MANFLIALFFRAWAATGEGWPVIEITTNCRVATPEALLGRERSAVNRDAGSVRTTEIQVGPAHHTVVRTAPGGGAPFSGLVVPVRHE
jgi:hypothetical protein